MSALQRLGPTDPSLHTPLKLGNLEPLGRGLPPAVSPDTVHTTASPACAATQHCTHKISLYWFYGNFSCSKPQHAKAADNQHNDIAKHWNEITIPGHWLGTNYTDRWAPDSSKIHIKRPNEKRVLPKTKQPHTNISVSGKASTGPLIQT